MPLCKFCTNALGKRKKFESNKFNSQYCLETEACISAWRQDRISGLSKQKEVKRKAETKIAKENIKTKSDYEKDLQKEINSIVRLIDRNGHCISTLKPLNEKFDAGHLFSVGSNPTLRFNLFNIYSQSVHANQYLSGDQINFLGGLSHFYGSEHTSYVLTLKSRFKSLKLSQDELREKIRIARSIVKELKADERMNFDYPERLEMRRKINRKIGIYLE